VVCYFTIVKISLTLILWKSLLFIFVQKSILKQKKKATAYRGVKDKVEIGRKA